MLITASRAVTISMLLVAAFAPVPVQAAVSDSSFASVGFSAQPGVARLVSAHVVNMSQVPAATVRRGLGPPREMPFLTVVSPTEYASLKRLAAFNSAAPFVPFAVNELAIAQFLTSVFTPSPTVAFNGMSDSGTICPPFGCQPPDMALAASPNWVLQGVNTAFAVFNTSGTLQPGWPKTASDFFGVPNPGSCAPFGPFLSDPRGFFDISDQRFWVAFLEVEGALRFNSSCPLVSRYWIAVSQTSNPNGLWNVYAYDMTLGTQNWADFTQIGLDQRAFYFSANMFTSFTGQFRYSELFSANKTSLENGIKAPAFGFVNLTIDHQIPQSVLSVQPTLELSSSPVEFAVNSMEFTHAPRIFCGFPVACSGIVTWAIANGGTPQVSISGVTVNSPTYALAPKASQPTCSQCIETLDTRISGTPVFRNGLISFALETGVNNGTAIVPGILWGQIHPALSGSTITGGSMFQSNYYAFSDNNAASFGTLMADKSGNLFMVFDNMGPTIDPSILYVARKATSPLGRFAPFVVLKAGVAPTDNLAWGDYEATSYDGSNVWLASEYSGANHTFFFPHDWSTFIGETHF